MLPANYLLKCNRKHLTVTAESTYQYYTLTQRCTPTGYSAVQQADESNL